MAPRTAKAKKATDVSEAPKKGGRGKAKNVDEAELDVEEQNIDEKVVATVTEKKKRGKKAAGDANGEVENGKTEDTAPPAKKGRKKNTEEPTEDNELEKPESLSGLSGEESAAVEGEAENDDAKETQSALSGRGRKKPTKKEPAVKPEAKPSRGRKAKQETEIEDSNEVEEKPKPAAKGRGRKAQPKPEQEAEEDEIEEVTKSIPPPTKGRKKAQPKPAKEKTPESDEQEIEDKESQESEELSKKKETKGRGRNQGKKPPAKEDSDEKEEDAEEAPAKKRKVNKKEEKAKGDSKDQEADEEAPEPKPKGRGRGKKAVEQPAEKAAEEVEDDAQDSGEVTNKRGRKLADDKAPADDKKKPLPKNKSATNYEELDFSNTSKTSHGKDWNFKIASWNVDGIRAWMNKGGLDYLTYEKPNILCLQETKCAKDKLPEELVNLPGYHAYWECSDKDGYAGVCIYTTQLAMNVQYGLQNEELDNEGRIITAEYEQFYLICTYVPNAGRKLVTLPKRLQWNEEFRKFVKELDKKKPVIICGDMNVSHKEIDLANPKTNKKNAGFTEEERAGMTELLGDGFVDTFRHLYPDKTGAYTFWTYMMNSRAKNVGWRLDYFIVSERLLPALCDNVIRDQVYGSDHCPISLFLHLKGADQPKE